MIKVEGIDHVAVNVRDLDKSLKFYTEVLGLKVTGREPSKPGVEYFLDCGPSLIGLIQAKDTDNPYPFREEGLGANHFSFRVRSGDFDQIVSHLEAHGVNIAFAKKRPKSWSLYFYDLDGNKLEMTAWPVEDGIAQEKIQKLIYDPQKKNWKPYE